MSNKFVLWLDLLGFKQFLFDSARVERDWPKIEKDLNNMILATQRSAKSFGLELQGTVISDTLIFHISRTSGKALALLSLISCEFQAYFMKVGFLSRGVISLGEIYSPKYQNISSYIGGSIVEAATFESELNSPIIILAPSALEYVCDNEEIWEDELISEEISEKLSLRSMMYPIEAEFKKIETHATFMVAHTEYYIENLKAYLEIAFSNRDREYSAPELIAIGSKLKALKVVLVSILKERADFPTDIIDHLDFILENISRVTKS